jgi:hypothetical protein
MTNLLEQAINCNDGDRAARIIQDALGIESDDAPPPSQGNELFLGEEELSDVSLGTFYVFDKENTGAPPLAQHLRLAHGGCGGGCGCGGFFFGSCVGCVGYACGGSGGDPVQAALR